MPTWLEDRLGRSRRYRLDPRLDVATVLVVVRPGCLQTKFSGGLSLNLNVVDLRGRICRRGLLEAGAQRDIVDVEVRLSIVVHWIIAIESKKIP